MDGGGVDDGPGIDDEARDGGRPTAAVGGEEAREAFGDDELLLGCTNATLFGTFAFFVVCCPFRLAL